ncbi:MAG: RMD1 family protein [Gammaproteobacteria bacterium]|nr:MAG: RMD1 family protein [Gammaproteobacteria bacterium]
MSTLFNAKTTIHGRALFVGERIDLRPLEKASKLAIAPLVVAAGQQGCAVLFRYGAVVLFNLSAMEEASFLEHLRPFIHDPLPEEAIETEEVDIHLDPQGQDRVEGGDIYLQNFSYTRLQVVAIILAKSVVLAYYETKVTGVFERIEPLAVALQKGRGWRKARQLLRYIGETLLIQHRMVGRVEVLEKPEFLWEHGELERFYLRLEEEYELHERHRILERKLDLISKTAETLLDLLQSSRSLRVEWYIVALIVVEIALSLLPSL